jgi:L-serine dehydratase
MESISVFDILKIGVGPSSSHTMGPWRAAQRFLDRCIASNDFAKITSITVHLFGSLAKTGKGHGTDFAVMMGLSGEDPVTCDVAQLPELQKEIRSRRTLSLRGSREIPFDPATQIRFHVTQVLPYHPNALTFEATLADNSKIAETYYSVGGGFIVQEEQTDAEHRQRVRLPFPIEKSAELERYCQEQNATIPQIVMRNELTWRTHDQVREGLLHIWRVMRECIYRGCHTAGTLPGGLNVSRRAARLNHQLLGIAFSHEGDKLGATVPIVNETNVSTWMRAVRRDGQSTLAHTFQDTLKWVSTFALAVNEENAAFGRVVTAPTNGAAGVIPSVMMYAACFMQATDDQIIDFMLTAGEIGSLFKKGATISAAMGGCQAEIGVSSAMAAAGLAQMMGASPGQVLQAAEIAMEHHLGMTCDPIAGLVQIPCIERNTMGAIKAITAANIAIESDPTQAKVTLDGVIKTMWETAKDMKSKYKETAEGGLAINISVNVSEC